MGHKKKVSYHQGGFYCSSLPVGLGGNLNFFKENCGILRGHNSELGQPGEEAPQLKSPCLPWKCIRLMSITFISKYIYTDPRAPQKAIEHLKRQMSKQHSKFRVS